MESFHWNDHFETGLRKIDHQHRYLVDIINRLGDSVSENVLDPDAIDRMVAIG